MSPHFAPFGAEGTRSRSLHRRMGPTPGALQSLYAAQHRANETACNGVSLLHAPASGTPRGARRGWTQCEGRSKPLRKAATPRRKKAPKRGFSRMARGFAGSHERPGQGCTDCTAWQFLSQREIPVRARGPPAALGRGLDCVPAPIAQKTHANPVGGRGISAFSPRFFSAEGIFVGEVRGGRARAPAGRGRA